MPTEKAAGIIISRTFYVNILLVADATGRPVPAGGPGDSEQQQLLQNQPSQVQ